MKREFKLLVLGVSLCAYSASFAQGTLKQETKHQKNSQDPVAYVYVSSSPSSSYNEVEAYSANAAGELTTISGSPFDASVTSMAVNGKYLFGTGTNSMSVDSYLIEDDGALTYTASTNAVKKNYDGCGYSGPLFLDHTGASVYDFELYGDCANNFIDSFTVKKASGQLQYLGGANGGAWLENPAVFIGNNVYAYSASCLSDMYWAIFGFKRASDGMLSQINSTAPLPKPKEGDFYCPSLAAADPTNHVAITMQSVNGEEFNPDGLPQIASYTADSAGNLSTTNTNEDMPTTEVVNVTDIKMAPSGELLAVAGAGGLQIFHFNGSKPVKHYTGLLTTDPVNQAFWDNDNHLYAIGAGKLFVFTITPTSYKEAAGSPYSIINPQGITVQPK